MRKWTRKKLNFDRPPDGTDRIIQLFFAALILAAVLRFIGII